MKKILLNLFALLIGLFTFAQNSAPSSHMSVNDNVLGDIIMKTVRSTITTTSTYYCTMQWNPGIEGGAYCGFQDSSTNGHQFIYSIWDPSNGQPITAAYRPEGTVVQNFGGEGTGLKSENQSIGWDLYEWNTLVTRRWDVGNHTFFGFWIRRDSQNKWYHMVTMDYPVANVNFNGGTNAFLEDWLATGNNTRRFEMKDVFKRKLDGSWLPVTQANFSVNSGDVSAGGRSANYSTSYNAEENNGIFAMQIGGSTTPSFTGTATTLTASTYSTEPQNPNINFTIEAAATNGVIWKVPESSTPQFKFTIKINNVTIASNIEPEARQFNFSASAGDSIEVILEDILGRSSTVSSTIASGTIEDPEVVDYTLANGTYKITGIESDKVLAPTTSNAWINLETYNGSDNQHWVITNQGNGDYIIKNTGFTDQSLDAFIADSKVGIYQSHSAPVGANQKWYLTHVSDGKYKITSVGTGKVAKASGTTNGSNINLISPYTGHDSELFTFTLVEDEIEETSLPNGTYKISVENSGRVIDAFGPYDGDNVGIYDFHGGTNQQWEITQLNPNIYKIISKNSGKAMEAFSSTNNSNVGVYSYDGDTNQQWEITTTDGITYKIINVSSSRSLDAFGSSNSSNVGIYDYHGGANQQFHLTLISSSSSKTSVKQLLDTKTISTSYKSFNAFPDYNLKTLNIIVPDGLDKNEVSLKLYSLNGFKVLDETIKTNQKTSLNINHLSNGFYIIKCEDFTKKIILH